MTKIGIITTSHAVNYGAVLQCFALRYSLFNAGADVVDVVNYCSDERIAGRKEFKACSSLKNVIYNVLIFFKYKYRKNRKQLWVLFDEFKRERLNIKGKLINNKKELEETLFYDTLICGSDQIWNLNLFNDDVYFLNFSTQVHTKFYYAYSASIAEQLSKEQELQFKKLTKRFKQISIREKKAAEWLGMLLNRTVLSTLDPVFLLPANEWSKLCSGIQKLVKEKYALVFMISHEKDDQKIVNTIAKGFEEKLVILNLHPFKYLRGDLYLNIVSPEQFIALIKDAEFIITDSFHATSFSIIFNKVFYNIRRSTRNIRIENLYEVLEIDNRYVEAGKSFKTKNIDYKKVNHNLNNNRDASMNYIKQIVGGK